MLEKVERRVTPILHNSNTPNAASLSIHFLFPLPIGLAGQASYRFGFGGSRNFLRAGSGFDFEALC